MTFVLVCCIFYFEYTFYHLILTILLYECYMKANTTEYTQYIKNYLFELLLNNEKSLYNFFNIFQLYYSSQAFMYIHIL
jgi:hypothetical protein